MGLFDIFKKKKQAVKIPTEENIVTSNTVTTECHHVAGTSYRSQNIAKLGTLNPDYKLSNKDLKEMASDDYEKIPEYIFDNEALSVVLEEEPDNKYDKNAIKVLINNIFVGYIKKGSCSRVKKLLKNDSIIMITAAIDNGPCKIIRFDEDTEKYKITKEKDLNFSIVLTFTIRSKA